MYLCIYASIYLYINMWPSYKTDVTVPVKQNGKRGVNPNPIYLYMSISICIYIYI